MSPLKGGGKRLGCGDNHPHPTPFLPAPSPGEKGKSYKYWTKKIKTKKEVKKRGHAICETSLFF